MTDWTRHLEPVYRAASSYFECTQLLKDLGDEACFERGKAGDSISTRHAKLGSRTDDQSIIRQDPKFALIAGRKHHLSAFGLTGYAILSSASLSDALKILANYRPLLNMEYDVELCEEAYNAFITLDVWKPVIDDVTRSQIEFEIGKLVTLLSDMVGAEQPVLEVQFSFPPRFSESDYRLILRSQVTFNAPCNRLRIHRELVDAALPQAYALTSRTCLLACDRAMKEVRGKSDAVSFVKGILKQSKEGLPSLDDIASVMCISSRSLRRRLDAQGTTYKRILDGFREEAAISYVANTQLTAEAISELLGYSDAANFRHAFKRWTGHPPREYRLQLACNTKS
ncbi:AraC family transcriptional regulator ligand-binding domain-containing protein [Paraburkholderia sp.]|uniref:AraC family transcriptional regulator n=1 Tax=Paraburkholderia sp. TaxID=1926495 RepID=UPI003C7A9A5D